MGSIERSGRIIIHGFDPGGTTGYVRIGSEEGSVELLDVREFKTHSELLELFRQMDPHVDVVVYESFHAMHGRVTDISAEVIGYILCLRDMLSVPTYSQTPSTRKFATCRWAGIHNFPEISKHAYDAFLHAMTFNVRAFGRDTFQFIDKR